MGSLETTLAMYCFQEGFYDASSTYLRQVLAIANDPAVKADCHLWLGRVREAANDYVGALQYYEEAFKFDAGCDDTWYFLHNNRAFCLNQLGRHEEANRYSRRAIEIQPNRYNAYKNLGVALEGQSAYAEAAACFLQPFFLKIPRVAQIWLVGVTCPRFLTHLDEGISLGETERTANPVQTTDVWRVRKGLPKLAKKDLLYNSG